MAAEKQPNILVIWGDDIGMWNISAYSHVSASVMAQPAIPAEHVPT